MWGTPKETARAGADNFLVCLLFLFLPFCFLCATACRGASLMQEPSGLLAPFLRVFFSLFRRRSETSGAAAPQRPVAQTCAGGPT